MKRLRDEFVAKYPDVALDEEEGEDADIQDLGAGQELGADGSNKKQKLFFEPSLRNGNLKSKILYFIAIQI